MQSLADLKILLYGPRKHVLIDVISLWLDESSDQKQKTLITVAGFLQDGWHWLELERDWKNVLSDPQIDIPYFRSTDCASVSGPFLKFRSNSEVIGDEDYQCAFAVRNRLLGSIRKGDLMGVAVSVFIEDYKEVMATHPLASRYFDPDPFFVAYQLVMVETAIKVAAEMPQEVIAYVYDENDKQSKAEAVYEALKQKNPDHAKYMGSLTHMDDKTTSALQAADLMASEARRETEAWLQRSGKHSRVFETLRQNKNMWYIGALNKEHMLDIIKDSIDDDASRVLALRARMAL